MTNEQPASQPINQPTDQPSSQLPPQPSPEPLSRHASHQPNRLIHEKSPYLLQHAHNPVNWYPWGEEAFAKARAEDKPVLLSIGYSTCHWCHVMERESFENKDIARLMNEWFVPVKVDREERPDIDQIYMATVIAMAGQGGWPMTVFLTPDGKPFYAGTYYPPTQRWGRPGMMELLPAVAKAWHENRENVLATADRIVRQLRQAEAGGEEEREGGLSSENGVEVPGALGPTGMEGLSEALDGAYRQLSSSFDAEWGGFGSAPKFPRPHVLSLLLRYWDRHRDSSALRMAERTLDHMADGGLRDHLGGGFHRYSVDGQWLVPHFEKMLYDQALLLRAYAEAYQITGKPRYAEVARDICAYVFRDLTDRERGGFYSAEDADSEGEEGVFYVWTPAEIAEALGEDAGRRVAEFYGVTESGNFEGRNILHVRQDAEAFAQARGLDAASLRAELAAGRERLFAVRARRIRPHRDDKVLTDWNGLMIGALACAGRALDEPSYLRAAERAASFLLGVLQRDGGLLHRYRDGDAAINGFLDDYAFLASGLTELYEATGNVRWLAEAVRLTDDMIDRFWDAQRNGFVFTSLREEPWLLRRRELYDGAVPSGNSAAVYNLVRLGRLTGNARFQEYADRAFRVFGDEVRQAPMAYPMFLQAVDVAMGPGREVVLAAERPDDPVFLEMRRAAQSRFCPRQVTVAYAANDPQADTLFRLAPFVRAQRPADGRATAYVCENHACRQPVTSVEELAALLGQ